MTSAAGQGPLPAGAAVLAAAGGSGIVVVGEELAPPLPSRSSALLAGGDDVGAVVPARPGPSVPPVGPTADAVRADVDDVVSPVVAVAPGLLADLRIDPRADDGVAVASAVVDHVLAKGRRVLTDPEWTTDIDRDDLSAAKSARPVAAEILVITAYLDDSMALLEDRLAFALVRSLRDQTVDARITVLLTDGFRSEHKVDRLRSNGVHVVVPPVDRDRWLAERAGAFSHAVLTSSGMQSLSWSWLAKTQPQAARVLYLSSLPFREVSALAPLTPPAEQASLESVRSGVESQVLDVARSADAIWCDADADARWVRGCLPGTPVHVIPTAIARRPDTVGLAGRSGVALLGDIGHDAVASNEDAAGGALESLVPALRSSNPDLPFTVITDRPSPYLRHTMEEHGAIIVPGAVGSVAVERARLLVDLHTFGTGGEAAIWLALATRTPFIAHPAAAGRLELGRLGGMSLFGALADLSFRSQALLDDDARWLAVRDLIDDLVAREFDGARRASALRVALASVGVETTSTGGQWIEDAPAKDRRGRQRPLTVAIRPDGFARRPPLRGDLPSPWDHDRRYQLWAERYGPTADAVAALRTEVQRLPYQPTISVLVPVYNTPGAILRETIESVQAQIYPHWELCLADDRSSLPETRAVLAEVEVLDGVKVVHLDGNSGISAATNAAAAVAEGEFVAFLDHDDLLKSHSLAQVVRWLNADRDLDYIYTDEDKVDAAGKLVQPHIKPDWSPNMIMSQNYVCHLSVIRRSLYEELGGLRPSFDGSQDHDLVLRVAERTDRIAHIPEPLYSWRIMAGSTSAGVDAKPYAADAARRALREALGRRDRPGSVENATIQGMYRTRYQLPGSPRVAIIIPTKGALHLLEPCIRSIYERSTYSNFEVVVIDNQTTDGPTLEYLADFPGRVLRYDHIFNYARMMNAAARIVDCDAFLFLNNDTEVITPEWIEELLQHAMRPEVGAVGGRLYHGDGRVQHEGIVVGLGGWANNIDHQGYWGRGDIIRDTSAVTGACTMIRSSVYWRVGGNEERLRVAYNDVDICLRIRQAGYQVIYTPYAELYHHEGSSRSGMEHAEDGPQFGIRWRPTEGVDPFFNPAFQKVMPPFVIGL